MNMDMMELMKTRRTYRRFEQKPVPQEVLDEILLATRYSSSAANKQPLSYIVVNDPAKLEDVFQYLTWAGQLPRELGWPKEGEKPVLYIAVIAHPEVSAFCDVDAGIAMSNMTMAAWNHGVGSCMIGACNKTKLGELFGLSDNEKVHTVLAFGYPSHTSEIVDPEEDGKLNYFVDDKVNYFVKKRKLEDTVRYF